MNHVIPRPHSPTLMFDTSLAPANLSFRSCLTRRPWTLPAGTPAVQTLCAGPTTSQPVSRSGTGPSFGPFRCWTEDASRASIVAGTDPSSTSILSRTSNREFPTTVVTSGVDATTGPTTHIAADDRCMSQDVGTTYLVHAIDRHRPCAMVYESLAPATNAVMTPLPTAKRLPVLPSVLRSPKEKVISPLPTGLMSTRPGYPSIRQTHSRPGTQACLPSHPACTSPYTASLQHPKVQKASLCHNCNLGCRSTSVYDISAAQTAAMQPHSAMRSRIHRSLQCVMTSLGDQHNR